jgi:hypothetical protein
MTVALLSDLKAEVIFLPKSANTIFDNYFTYLFIYFNNLFSQFTLFPLEERDTASTSLSIVLLKNMNEVVLTRFVVSEFCGNFSIAN